MWGNRHRFDRMQPSSTAAVTRSGRAVKERLTGKILTQYNSHSPAFSQSIAIFVSVSASPHPHLYPVRPPASVSRK